MGVTCPIPCWLVMLCLSACASGPPGAAVHTLSFEEDAIGAPPHGFVVGESNGQGSLASWQVVDGIDADDPGHVVRVDTVNTGRTYNLLLSAADHAAFFALTVARYPQSEREA